MQGAIESNLIYVSYIAVQNEANFNDGRPTTKSGFTSVGLWNILYLLASISKVISTILRALDSL
jgi:hypothetical protein